MNPFEWALRELRVGDRVEAIPVIDEYPRGTVKEVNAHYVAILWDGSKAPVRYPTTGRPCRKVVP